MTPKTFKNIRTRLNLTQPQLAKTIGVSDVRTIRRYEAGEREISGPVVLIMRLLEAGQITTVDADFWRRQEMTAEEAWNN